MRSEAGWRGRLRGLYAITPAIADTEELARRVQAALEGGAALVQYRSKGASPGLALVQARRIAHLCAARGVPFVVNDSIALASAVDADGVHLGREDEDPRAARMVMPQALIGVSCYADAERARAAAQAGADYVAVGSVFPSATKPHAVQAPLEALARAREASALPVVAIGGITPDNAAAAIAAGADMVAVISAVFDAPDVRAAAAAFARLFTPSSKGETDVRTQP